MAGLTPDAPGYPAQATAVNHVAPVPRRVRAVVDGQPVLDTTRAMYVWEWSNYPQFYVPSDDVRMELLLPAASTVASPQGDGERRSLRVGAVERPDAAVVMVRSPLERVAGTVRFEFSALDHWFEEDEEIWVHPRSPYVRVDALRSRRRVRIELAGTVVAVSSDPVLVFETGLPTRYYLSPSDVDQSCLVPSTTRTACPYKGRTTGYWSVAAGGTVATDVAWCYDWPVPALAPVAGRVGFLNEELDVVVDGVAQPRPRTHMGPDRG